MEKLTYKTPITDIVLVTEREDMLKVSGTLEDNTPIPPGGRVQGKENDFFGNGDNVEPVSTWTPWED